MVNKHLDISIGTQYRDAPNVVREVITLYVGVDGLPHAVLSNVSDPTCRKTLSQIELEHGGQYFRVPAR